MIHKMVGALVMVGLVGCVGAAENESGEDSEENVGVSASALNADAGSPANPLDTIAQLPIPEVAVYCYQQLPDGVIKRCLLPCAAGCQVLAIRRAVERQR